jgi:YfiH family protein
MPPSWQWQTWNNQPYLTCSLLEAWPHGFFTQQSWPKTPQVLAEALHPQATVHRIKQVHGNRVLNASASADNAPTPEFPEADGLISDRQTQAVWVCSADCTPALIADVSTGQVAAVHAGWRGTAQKIVPEAVSLLLAQGSHLGDLRVALGPAIAGEVYQVSTTVAAEVGASLTTVAYPSPEDVLTHLLDQPDSPFLSDLEPNRMRLDVRRVIQRQLLNMEFEADQIAIAPHCTYQEPDTFFSYRRTQQKRVQWSGIVSL